MIFLHHESKRRSFVQNSVTEEEWLREYCGEYSVKIQDIDKDLEYLEPWNNLWLDSRTRWIEKKVSYSESDRTKLRVLSP